MTVFDGERHLAEAVESILGQTFTDFEFVVVDDGSTDSTPEILRRYGDSRLRVLSPGRLGRAAALNLGVREAVAPLIALMDADDVSLERRLERQLDLLASSPATGVCSTWLEVIDEAGGVLRQMAFPTCDADLRRRFLRGNPIGGPAAVVRREVFDQVGGFREEFVPSEDHDLWRRALGSFSFAVLPEFLFRYRQNPRGLSHVQRERQAELTREITRDVRTRPFPLYGTRDVVRGARLYRGFEESVREQLLRDYAADQAFISSMLLRRGRVRAGLANLVGTLLFRPTATLTFLRQARVRG